MPALVNGSHSAAPSTTETSEEALLAEDPHLEGYTPQTFPNISDESKGKPARLVVSRDISLPAQLAERHHVIDLARAAWVRLAMAYADVDDIVLNELSQSPDSSQDQLSVTFVRLKSPGDSRAADVAETLARDAAKGPSHNAASTHSIGPVSFLADSHASSSWFPQSGVALEVRSQRGNGAQLQVNLIADASNCSDKAAANMLAQLEALIDELSASPNAPFMPNGKTSLSFASRPEESALHSTYRAPHDPNRARLPIEWLYEQGRRRPNAIAHELFATGTSPKQVLTYGDLNNKSNQMARWLIAHADVGRETRVAICRDRDAGFYICMAAILKAGGCYVPIDVDLPPERKRFIASDSSAALVLCKSEETANFDSATQEVDSQKLWDQVAALSSERFETTDTHLDGLSYLQYTSGTTGTPKGCKLTHRGLFWAIEAMVEMPRRITDADNDKRLAMAAVAFDVHVSEIVQSWALGTRLVSVRSRLELISNLQQYIEDFGITHIGMVPSMIESCLFKNPEELPLKYMVSGGDKLSDEVLSKWAANPKLLFAQFYGPSECHIGCLARQMRGVMDRKDNIGLPFPGCSAYVVDADLNIVPRGTPGELVVEGDLVGTGYLGLEAATRKNFIEFPRPGCRAYRTGDLVRMNHDGSILISGRVDSQIKLRGVRIESEGVSNVIRQASKDLPLEAVTAISTHPDTGSAEILVTFVAPQGVYSAVERREYPSLQELPDDLSSILRTAAETELASYMRPGHIVPVKFLPLSHNGKVDNKILLQMFQKSDMQELQRVQKLSITEDSQSEDDTVDELTATETTICELVASIIDVPQEQLKPSRRLFEMGLSSLQFARLSAFINKRFQAHLAVAAVMSAGTIRGAARLVDDRSVTTDDASRKHLDLEQYQKQHLSTATAVFKSDDIEAVLPPLPVQPGILAQIVQSPSASYVQHFLYQIQDSNGLSIESVTEAIHQLVAFQQMLRTVFIVDEADLLQVVLKEKCVGSPLSSTETHCKNPADFVNYFQRDQANAVAARINEDLTTPMWEIGLYTDASSQQVSYLSLSLSHVVYDAFATAALMRGLDRLLVKETSPVQATLQTVLQEIGETSTEEHQEFWNRFLTPALTSAGRAPPRQLSAGEATRQSRSFDIPLSDVQSQSRKVGVTMEAFFNTCFALSGRQLKLWQDHALFGTVQSGRTLGVEGVESAVMPLVTVFPLAIDLSSQDISSTLGRAQSALLAASSHSHFPLGQIQAAVKQRQLFDTLFSCRQSHAATPYRKFTHLETSSTTLEFPLAIEVLFDTSADTIEVSAASSDGAFESALVADLLQNLEETAADICMRDDLQAVDVTEDVAVSRVSSNGAKSELADAADESVDAEAVSAIIETTAAFLQLDASKVGAKTSLVSLGITSLSAVALSMRLQEVGVNVDAISILQGDRPSRIAALAKPSELSDGEEGGARPSEIENQLLKELQSSAVSLSRTDTISLSPATPLQEGMLSQTVATRGQSYIHAFPLTLAPDVDLDRLQEAWRKAVASFDILRTTFHFASESGHWAAVMHDQAALDLPWQQSASDEPSDMLSKAAVTSLSLQDSEDFARRPAWQLKLVTRSNGTEERILIVVAHHAYYDGASMHSLLSHVSNLYHGHEIPPSATGSFQDFAKAVSRGVDKSVAYWVKQLNSIPVLGQRNMPSGRKASDQNASQAWRASHAVEQTLTDDLSRLCRRYRVTTQSVAQLALARAVSLWSGIRDVVFCQVVGGRTGKGTGELVGPCFNTIPCKVSLQHPVSAREGLKSVHIANMQALPHQHAPLRAIQKGCGVSSISDVLFVFQPKLVDDANGDEQKSIWQAVPRSSEVNETTTHFALNVEVWEKKDGLEIKSSASVDCMRERSELQEFIGLYAECLRVIVSAPAENLLPKRWQPKFPVEHITTTESKSVSNEQASVSDQQLGDSEAVSVVRDAICRTTKLDPSKVLLTSGLASLGLDSISAIQVASHTRQAGIRLSPADIVKSPNVRALFVKVYEQERETHDENSKAGINGSTAPMQRQPAMLSEEQLRRAEAKVDPSLRGKVSAWRPTPGMETVFNGWQSSGGRFAQMVLVRQAVQELDVKRLQQAWTELTQRHETLRSTMVPLSDRGQDRCALLVVDSPEDWTPHFQVERYDESEGNGDHFAISRAKQFLLQPPAICTPPNTMVALTQRDRVTHVVMYLPHFQYDGWSLGPLIKDLELLYVGAKPRASHDLRGLLRACSVCEDGNGLEAEYWHKELSEVDLDSTRLRTHRVPEADDHPVTLYHTMATPDMPLMTSLDEVAKSQDVTLSSLFFATWSLLQRRRSVRGNEAESTCFSVVQHGRSLPLVGIENLATITMNLAPLPVSFKGVNGSTQREGIFDLAKRIQDHLNDRPAEADQCRWREISRWLGRDELSPLTNVVLNVQHFVQRGKSTANESAKGPKAQDTDAMPAFWKPLVVPFRLSEEEQNASLLSWEHLGQPSASTLSFAEMSHSALRIGVRSDKETGRLVLHAEYAKHALESAEVEEMMREWRSMCDELIK